MFTVSDEAPLLGLKRGSPPKLAVTAPGYVPSGIPATLMVRIAWPRPFVTAVPAGTPFRKNDTVLPAIDALFEDLLKFAVRMASPP